MDDGQTKRRGEGERGVVVKDKMSGEESNDGGLNMYIVWYLHTSVRSTLICHNAHLP